MRKLFLLSFIIFVSTSIGYSVGYRVGGVASTVLTKPIHKNVKPIHENVKPIHENVKHENVKANANVHFFQYVKHIDSWFFPCNGIYIEIIERDENSEKLYNELTKLIHKFVFDKKIAKSTFVEYCYAAGVNKN